MSNVLVFVRGKNECTHNLPKSFKLVDKIIYRVSSVALIFFEHPEQSCLLIRRRIISREHNQENFLSKWLVKIIQKLFLDCPISVRYWFEEMRTRVHTWTWLVFKIVCRVLHHIAYFQVFFQVEGSVSLLERFSTTYMVQGL